MNALYSPQSGNNISSVLINNRLEKLPDSNKNIEDQYSAKIKELAEEFESFLLYYVLKSMRKAVPKSDLLHSNAEDIYTSMLDQEIAASSSKKGGGLGLARIIQQQLTNRGKQTLEERSRVISKYKRAITD